MIEEILIEYRYMSADERIKSMRVYNSYEFPYLCYGDMIGKYTIFICMNVYDECYNLLGRVGMNRNGLLVTDCPNYLNENKIKKHFH